MWAELIKRAAKNGTIPEGLELGQASVNYSNKDRIIGISYQGMDGFQSTSIKRKQMPRIEPVSDEAIPTVPTVPEGAETGLVEGQGESAGQATPITETIPEETRNQLVITRVGKDPFVMKRGDRVQYLIGKKLHEGTIVGVSRAKQQISVESDSAAGKGGICLIKDSFILLITKNITTSPETKIPDTEPLSGVIKDVNRKNEPPGGWSEADKVSPFTPGTMVYNKKTGSPFKIIEVSGNIAKVENAKGNRMPMPLDQLSVKKQSETKKPAEPAKQTGTSQS